MKQKTVKVLTLALFISFTLQAQETYTITFQAGEGGAIYGQNVQELKPDSSTTPVTADPDFNMSFVNWTLPAGTVFSTNPTLIIDSVQSSLTIRANFEEKIISTPVIKKIMTLPEPLSISGFIDSVYTGAGGVSLGESISITGGTPGYFYQWADEQGDLSNNPTIHINPDENRYYVLTTSDLQNCSLTDTVFVFFLTGTNLQRSPVIEIWPNPGTKFHISLENYPQESISVLFYDLGGKLLYEQQINHTGQNQAYELEPSLATGIYLLKISSTTFSAEKKLVIQ